MSLVNISIVGNVVKPPQQQAFSSGRTKTTIIVAVDAASRKGDGGKSEADYYRVEAWGKLGEIAHKYLSKGNLVGATGRLVMDRWTDREGTPRVTPTVEASQIALPPKGNNNSSAQTNPVAGEMHFDSDEEWSPNDRGTPAAGASADSSAGTAGVPSTDEVAGSAGVPPASLDSVFTESDSPSPHLVAESLISSVSIVSETEEDEYESALQVSGRRRRG